MGYPKRYYTEERIYGIILGVFVAPNEVNELHFYPLRY
jgi:hypothetical protein